jgi:CRP-like cAMP-binding protein
MPSAHGERPSVAAADPTGRLASIPIIDGLPPGPRDRLAAAIARLSVIVHGRVALRLRVPERGPVTILTLERGDIVGWSAIVPPHRATTSATALEPTELASLPAAELRAMLAADAEVAAAFLPPIIEAIAARVAATRDQLLDLFRGVGPEPW